MAYKIIISPRAQKEIENTIDFYSLNSKNAPASFVLALTNTYSTLQNNPYFKIRYKNIRSLKLKKFPYALFFVIDSKKMVIKIISCFHCKCNPAKLP